MSIVPTEDRLGELLLQWDELRRQGRDVSAGELCADCPELVDELRRRIEVVRDLEPVLDVEPTHLAATPRDVGADGLGPDRRLPDDLHAAAVYRPQRYHARGGLGEVLAAHQEELDRTVALKRIRPDRLHDTARRRFLREAAITARLQHPGIVPIYGLGHDKDGPFYTMPFIEGQTLQEAIDAFHGDEALGRDSGRRALSFRGLLQQFIAVCNTMAYAHDQGVIHRDLKPSNIMLGPYGETLVMDWGLAKRVGTDDAGVEVDGDAPSPSPSPEALTATGAVLGTPHYMSPEQARGEPTSPASDVFNLGLILYAILTGKSPYADAVLQGGNFQRAVREAAVVPPRRQNPGLPGALQAICLKALAARPEDRYSSPRALADDIAKWMADEPVAACPEPWLTRLARWSRHNRTTVGIAFTAMTVTLAGLMVILAVQADANQKLAFSRRRERDAKELAQAQFRLALDVVKSYHSGVSEEILFREPKFESLRKRLLGSSLSFYEKIHDIHKYSNNIYIDSRATLVEAYEGIGKIMLDVGSGADAIQAYRQAMELRREILRANPLDVRLRKDYADTLYRIALAYQRIGTADDAAHAYHEALNEHERLMREFPGEVETLAQTGNIYERIADLERAKGRYPEAFRYLERSRVILGNLVSQHPDVASYQSDLAAHLGSVGLLQRAEGRDADALRSLDQARVLFEKLAVENPSVDFYRRQLSTCYSVMGGIEDKVGRSAQALNDLEKAGQIREGLLRNNPNSLDHLGGLAGIYYEIGDVLARGIGKGDPLEKYEKARGLLERVLREDPDHIDAHSRLGTVLNNTAIWLAKDGRPNEALAKAELALPHARIAFEKKPQVIQHRRFLSDNYATIAEILRTLGRPAEASRATLDRVELWPSDPSELYDVARSLSSCIPLVGRGRVDLTLEQQSERRRYSDRAFELIRRAVHCGFMDIARMKSDYALDPIRSRSDFNLLLLDLTLPADPFTR